MYRQASMTSPIGFFLCVVRCLLLASGSMAQQPSDVATTSNEKAETQSLPSAKLVPDERYRIGPGDILIIRVFERPQLSRDDVRVDGTGRIRMPMIQDDLVAACQTEFGLADGIAERYRVYLKNPQVEVSVKEFSSEPVAVIGAVMKPGSFQLQRRVRLRELLTLAGGPSPDAGRSLQVIHDESTPACDTRMVRASFTNTDNPRASGSGGEATDDGENALTDSSVNSFSLQAILRGESSSNPYIRPGDFIHIPKADQVFVVGNVYKPSTVPMTDRLTVSRAIAMAGGVLPDTKRSNIRIVRSQGDGNTVLYVDLEHINHNEEADLLLQPNDIVEVPTSIGKMALRLFFTGIVPAYAVYGPLAIIH
jgi:polysaccharide biosynthesis/export protein